MFLTKISSTLKGFFFLNKCVYIYAAVVCLCKSVYFKSTSVWMSFVQAITVKWHSGLFYSQLYGKFVEVFEKYLANLTKFS